MSPSLAILAPHQKHHDIIAHKRSDVIIRQVFLFVLFVKLRTNISYVDWAINPVLRRVNMGYMFHFNLECKASMMSL